MDTSNGQPDPLAGTGISYQQEPPAQQTPQDTPAPKPTLQTGSDPLAGTGIEYEPSLSGTYRSVMDSDASQNAKIQHAATKSGLTPSQVAQDPKSAFKAVDGPTEDYLNRMKYTDPVTAKFASAPKTMASVYNDLHALQKHESVYADFYKYTGEALNSFLKYSVLGTPLENAGNRDWHIGPLRLGWDRQDVQDLIDHQQAKIDRVASPDKNADAIDEAWKGNLHPLAAQAIGLIPNLAKIGGLLAVNPAAVGVDVLNETAGQSYERSIQAGVDPMKASISATTKGTVAAGINMLTFGFIGKLYGPLVNSVGKQAAKEVIKRAVVAKLATDAAFIGGGQAQLLTNAAVNKFSGEDHDAFDHIGKKMVDEGLLDLFSSNLMTLPGLGITVMGKGRAAVAEGKATAKAASPEEALQSYHEEVATKGKEFFTKAVETSKARKVATDNPFQAKEHDDLLAKQYGPQTAHVPVEKFQEIFQDEAPKKAEEMGPDFKESYDRSVGVNGEPGTGETVHGPLSDMLNSKTDLKPTELGDHIKFSNENKTVFEAQESKKEMEAQVKETENERQAALDKFQKEVQTGIEGIGGKAGEGAATQAKGIAKVLDNLAKTINVPVSKLLQLYKFHILKEAPGETEKSLYQQAHGMVSPSDYIKEHGLKLLIEKPDDVKLSGNALEEAKAKWQSRVNDAKSAGIEVTFKKDAKGARSPADMAQDFFDAANGGELNRHSLPDEWWDEGKNGRPDAEHDTILELIRNGGSGVDTIKKMNQAMQEHYQSGADPFGLTPEEQKDIFGNEFKAQMAKLKAFEALSPEEQAKRQAEFEKEDLESRMNQGPRIKTDEEEAKLEEFRRNPRFLPPEELDKETQAIHDQHYEESKNEILKELEASGVDIDLLDKEELKKRAEKLADEKEAHDLKERPGYNYGKGLQNGIYDTGTDKTGPSVQGEEGNLPGNPPPTDEGTPGGTSGPTGTQTHFQARRGRVVISGLAGEPQGRTFTKYISENADKSTLFHEFAHDFLQIFRDHVSQGDAPAEALDIEKKLLDWFEVKNWNDVTDRHSEMFARGFEYRLWEGKSPSGLEKVFQKFAEWMRKIYPSSQVMDTYLKNVGAKMTDEMRGVYDRFIASSEEIQRAEKEMGYSKEAPKGLTPEEFNEWKSKQDEATQKAMDRLNSQKMAGLKEEAKNQVVMEREETTKKAEKEVDGLPIFQAQKDLEDLVSTFKGKTKDIGERYMKGETDDIENDALERIAIQHKFNNAAELAYGLANSNRELEIKDRVHAHMDEFTPKVHGSFEEAKLALLGGDEKSDAIAYEGALLKQAIADVQALKGNALKGEMEKTQGNKAVSGMTKAKPEPLSKEEIAAKQKAALKQYRKDKADAQAKVPDIMSKLTINESRNVSSFTADMKNAAKKSQEFSDKENPEKAYEWKKKQLLNNELALQAVRNKEIIRRAQKGLKEMGRIEKKPIAMPFGHWMQMKNILEQNGMKEPSKVQEYIFKKIAQKMLDEGKSNDEIADATGFTFDEDGQPTAESLQQFKTRMMDSDVNPQLAGRINVPENMDPKKMTLGDLRDISNSIQAIYKHGRDAHEVELGGKTVKREEFVGQFIKRMEETQGKKDGDKVVMPHDFSSPYPSKKEEVINALLNIDDHGTTMGVQLPRLANKLDGGDKGPANDLIDTLLKSQSDKTKMKQERIETHQDLKRKYYSPKEWDDFTSKRMTIPTSVGPVNMTKDMIRGVYEYSGTKEGLTYLKTGIGFTDDDLMALRNKLEKKDIDFIHEFNDKLVSAKWPDYVRTEMKVNGVEPKPVDLLPVETQHGIRPGVYRPLVADKRLSPIAQTLEEWTKGLRQSYEQAASYTPFKASTDKSFLKERSGVKGIAPLLNNLVWDKYLEQTESYLAYQPALKEVNKVLNDKQLMATMKRAIGPGADLWNQQIKYIVSGSNLQEGYIAKTLGNIRRLVVSSNIGIRPTLYVLKLMTDGINAFAEQKDGGLKWLAMQKDYGLHFGMMIPKTDGGTSEFHVGNAKMKDLMQKVNALSPSMKEQGTNFDWNARELSKFNLGDSAFSRFLQKNGLARWFGLNMYLPERSADAQVRYPKWWDTYQTEIASGTSKEQAAIYADKITNRLLGSATPLYHIGPQRGGELMKQFAPVISFASNQFNSFLQRGYWPAKDALFKGAPGAKLTALAAVAGAISLYFLAPAAMKTGVKLVTGKAKTDPKDMLKELGAETADEAFNGIPFAGFAAHAVRYQKQGKPATELPFQDFIMDNWEGASHLHYLNLDKLTEKDWDAELRAFTTDTGIPKTLETLTMNFVDHLNRQDEWSFKDFLSKRKLTGRR